MEIIIDKKGLEIYRLKFQVHQVSSAAFNYSLSTEGGRKVYLAQV